MNCGGDVLRREEGQPKGREQAVARKVARRTVAGDALGRPARGVDAGDGGSVAAQDAGVDLMRYVPDAPPGTMDFLFAKVLLHMQAQGYKNFGLGMSPIAGMATRRRAPRWQRLGRLLFQYGERFYSFRGLYNYKDKFEPTWEARYLAAPGGISPLLVLADVAALIGDGGKAGSDS